MKLTDARAILEGAGCILVDEGTVTAVNAVQEASDIIHQSFSDFVKERQMNEGFFKDRYTKYKDAVVSILKKEFGMVFPSDKIHALEDWIRDYFLDKFDEIDCAKAIRDNFRREFATESVEELEDAGFIVENRRGGIRFAHQTMPKDDGMDPEEEKKFKFFKYQIISYLKAALHISIEDAIRLVDEKYADRVLDHWSKVPSDNNEWHVLAQELAAQEKAA